jgi:hypothetical protein
MAETSSDTGSLAGRAFWLTLILLFAATVTLVLLASRPTAPPADLSPPAAAPTPEQAASSDPAPSPTAIDLAPGTLERIVETAAREAQRVTAAQLERELALLFAPVYAAIPRYADHHYSLAGEYSELIRAALAGRVSPALDARLGESIEARLLDGFDSRLEAALAALSTHYSAVFGAALAEQLESALPANPAALPLAPATQIAIDEALARARIGMPLAAIAATGAGTLAMKRALSTAAAAAAAKAAGKLAGKTLLKAGSSAVGGAGAGAATGTAVGGPVGAVVGGMIGATAAWIGVDWLVIRTDEYLNREAFEAELSQVVADEEQRLREALLEALQATSGALGGRSLRDIRRDTGDT